MEDQGGGGACTPIIHVRLDASMEVPIDDRDWMHKRSVFILPQKHLPVHQLKKHTRAFIMSPAREILSMLNANQTFKHKYHLNRPHK